MDPEFFDSPATSSSNIVPSIVPVDLEMEDKNRELNTCRLTGEGTELTVSVSGSGVVTPVSGVTKLTNVLSEQVIPQAPFCSNYFYCN